MGFKCPISHGKTSPLYTSCRGASMAITSTIQYWWMVGSCRERQLVQTGNEWPVLSPTLSHHATIYGIDLVTSRWLSNNSCSKVICSIWHFSLSLLGKNLVLDLNLVITFLLSHKKALTYKFRVSHFLGTDPSNFGKNAPRSTSNRRWNLRPHQQMPSPQYMSSKIRNCCFHQKVKD